MKISTILNERSGIINVPSETIAGVMSIVCSDFFSRAITYLHTLDDDYADLFPTYKKLLGEYRKKYGHFNLYQDFGFDKITKGSTVIRMSDIDPRYFNRNKDSKHRTYTLEVTVGVMDSNSQFAATYRKKTPRQSAGVNVWLPAEDHIVTVFKSPEIIPHTLERVDGYVEHELIHAVQDMALKQHDDTADAYDENGELNTEKYYMTDIEYSPQILTAAKDFIANVKELRSLGVNLTQEKIKAHLLRYINPQAPTVSGVDFPDSEFLHVLFNKDKAKWKKAINGFYGLVQKEFKL